MPIIDKAPRKVYFHRFKINCSLSSIFGSDLFRLFLGLDELVPTRNTSAIISHLDSVQTSLQALTDLTDVVLKSRSLRFINLFYFNIYFAQFADLMWSS